MKSTLWGFELHHNRAITLASFSPISNELKEITKYANQGRRCPKLTGVRASTVFTRYCWEHFNLSLFNLTANHQSFTVSCILGTNHVHRSARALKRSHIPGVKITLVDHGSCVGDEAVEGGLADATSPGHNSVNGRERGGVTS
ncbi:hypothetical protein YC2023_051176 [Brassica napus]